MFNTFTKIELWQLEEKIIKYWHQKILCKLGFHDYSSGYELEKVKLAKKFWVVHDMSTCYWCEKIGYLDSWYTDGKECW